LGDIITGGEDYKIRTFTRDPTRKESGEGLHDYEDECKVGAQGDNIDMDTLTEVDKINTVAGKEGEIKVFKDKGEAVAYMHKDGKWELIGSVINPAGGK
jgi:hypothetical protein